MSKIILEKDEINNGVNRNLKIVSISDAHDDGKDKRIEFYKKIYQTILTLEPDYICIPGDIIEAGNTSFANIESLIKDLGQLAHTVISLRNHYLQLDDYNKQVMYDWYMNLKKYSNIHPLDNDSFETEDVRFVGFTETLDSYLKQHKDEWKKMFIENFNAMNVCLDDSKYNILLAHKPITKEYFDLIPSMQMYNLILSGHMHNGCTPDFLCEFLDQFDITRGKGIFGPYFTLFSSHCRGVEKLGNNTYSHISKGLRKFTIDNRLFDFIDSFYNGHIHEINITLEEKTTRKLRLK